MNDKPKYLSHNLYPIYYNLFEKIVDEMDISLIEKQKIKLYLRKFILEIKKSENEVSSIIYSKLEELIVKNTNQYKKIEDKKKEQVDKIQLLSLIIGYDFKKMINSDEKIKNNMNKNYDSSMIKYANNSYGHEMHCIHSCCGSDIRETLISILENCVKLKNEDIKKENINSYENKELKIKKEKMKKLSKLFKKTFLFDEEDINLLHEISADITQLLIYENPISVHSNKNKGIRGINSIGYAFNKTKFSDFYKSTIYYEIGIESFDELINLYNNLQTKAKNYTKRNVNLSIKDYFRTDYARNNVIQAFKYENPKEPLSYEYILKQINLRIIDNYKLPIPPNTTNEDSYTKDLKEIIENITKRMNLSETMNLYVNSKKYIANYIDKTIAPFFNQYYLDNIFKDIIDRKKEKDTTIDEVNSSKRKI